MLAELTAKQVNRIELSKFEQWALENLPGRLERLQVQPPTDPWEVKDIRWEPPTVVTLKQLIAKYGKPETDNSDEQFRRVAEWKKRGVTAYLSDSGNVELIVYSFTFGDYACKSIWEKGKDCDSTNPKLAVDRELVDEAARKPRK